jgi:hypothetical protein
MALTTLLMRFGFTAHPGFKSPSLRPFEQGVRVNRAGSLLRSAVVAAPISGSGLEQAMEELHRHRRGRRISG